MAEIIDLSKEKENRIEKDPQKTEKEIEDEKKKLRKQKELSDRAANNARIISGLKKRKGGSGNIKA